MQICLPCLYRHVSCAHQCKESECRDPTWHNSRASCTNHACDAQTLPDEIVLAPVAEIEALYAAPLLSLLYKYLGHLVTSKQVLDIIATEYTHLLPTMIAKFIADSTADKSIARELFDPYKDLLGPTQLFPQNDPLPPSISACPLCILAAVDKVEATVCGATPPCDVQRLTQVNNLIVQEDPDRDAMDALILLARPFHLYAPHLYDQMMRTVSNPLVLLVATITEDTPLHAIESLCDKYAAYIECASVPDLSRKWRSPAVHSLFKILSECNLTEVCA